MSFRCEQLVGYSGARVSLLNSKEVVYAMGNNFMMVDVGTQVVRHVTDGASPVGCVAVNKLQTLLVAGNKGESAAIVTYSLPDLNRKQTIPAVGSTDCLDLSFSRDGASLVAVCGLPSFTVTVFSVNKATLHVSLSAKITSPQQQPRHASFSPFTNTELLTTGNNHVCFWKLEKIQSTHTFTPTEVATTSKITSACYSTQNGEALCGTASGDILEVDTTTGAATAWWESPGDGSAAITALNFTRHHLVATSQDGIMRFFRHDTHTIERSLTLASVKVQHVVAGHNWNTFIVCGGDGILQTVVLPGYEEMLLRADQFREMEDRGTPILDCPGGGFRGVCHLQAGNVVVAVSADGTLRTWDYVKSTLLAKLSCGKRPCSITAGEAAASHLVFVGYETSHLRLFDVSDFRRPRLISQEKLADEGGVTLVSVSPNGKHVVAFVEGTGLYFSDSVHHIHVLGCLPFDTQVKDIAWLPGGALVVASDNGDIKGISMPEYAAPPDTHQYPKSLITHLWRLDLPLEKMHVTAADSDGFTVVCCSRDKGVKLYTLDRNVKITDSSKVPVKKPQVQWKPSDKLGSAIIAVDDIIYSASRDGRIESRDLKGKSGEKPITSLNKHDCIYGGVVGMCASHNKKRLVTIGSDGLLGVYSISRDAGLEETPFRIVDQVGEEAEVHDEDTVYMVKVEEEKKRLVKIKYTSHRQGVIDQIAKLREQLQHYKEDNSKAQPEEKLETQAFMIESQRTAIAEEGEKLCEEKEEEIKWTNLTNDYISDTIKKEAWDSMQTPLMVTRGITGGSAVRVPNYNILKVSHKEKALLRKVRFLREVEQLEWTQRNGFEALDDLYSEEAEEEEEPEAPKSPEDAKSQDEKKSEEEVEELALEEEALLSADDHLYNKFATYTRSRTITQSVLLQQEIFVKRNEFNKQVADTMKHKKSEIAKICEKHVRMRQILKELDMVDTVADPTGAESEHPERVLTVGDDEINVVQREAEKLLEAEDGTRKDSEEHEANERALKIMMDNRLERDERVVVEIKKPSFADETHKDAKPQDDWTDEEMKMWRDYEKKLQKRAEEEEKHKRSLQQEHRELQKEVEGIITGYDARLQQLFNTKLGTDTAICQMDLQLIKLAQSRVQQDEMEQHYQELGEIVEKVKESSGKSMQLAVEAERELQTKHDKYEELLINEKKKSGEKEIRTQPPFSECEEYCDILVKLLKKSIKPKKEKQKKDKDDKKRREDANPDPFAFIEEEEEEKRRKVAQQPEVAEVKLDKPEGLREDLWREFLDFRRERIEAEREQKLLSDELQEMTKVVDNLTRESKAQQQNLEKEQALLTDFRQQMIRESYNLDILHTFKQGKIEVEQEAVVTDYADGILIHKNNIQELNVQIKEHGQAKVDKMMEIMQFKKGIRYIEWENQMLKHEVRFCEMEYKHLHTLRVTKAMQEFIKGGGENHHDVERAGIMKKIEHLQQAMQSKIEEKKQAMQKIKRIIREKDIENNDLEQQVKEATQLVSQRDEIYHLQSTGLDHQRNLKLMKDMRVTRKLEDVAKAQQEEMKLLKKEIDRLRERTFPSFAVVSKRVVGNPDELQ